MTDFEKGDRVIILKHSGPLIPGNIGTVVEPNWRDRSVVGVDWDGLEEGWNLDGNASTQYSGYRVSANTLKKQVLTWKETLEG